MKKIILKPKAIILTFLFLGILAILVKVTSDALAQMSLYNGGYYGDLHRAGSNYSRTYSGDINLLRIGINSDECYQNNDPNNDYFIPYNTYDEYSAFRNAVAGNRVPNVSRVSCCDNAPNNIYYNAGYYTKSQCNSNYPGCVLNSNWGYNVASNGSLGDACGIYKWRATQCGTLFKATSICDGDPCINGIDLYGGYSNPKFCVGRYDSLLKICVYQYEAPVSVSNDTYTFYPMNSPYANNTVGSWGSCGTNPICGDNHCSSEYGETSSTCPTDCGALPPNCSLYIKSLQCTTVSGCIWVNNICISGSDAIQ